MKKIVTSKQLEVLAYCGTLVYLATVSLTVIWSKIYSSTKPFYGSPQTVALLFVLGCVVASGLFGFALAHRGKKVIFVPALTVSVITGIVGLLVLWFVSALMSWGSQ